MDDSFILLRFETSLKEDFGCQLEDGKELHGGDFLIGRDVTLPTSLERSPRKKAIFDWPKCAP